MQLLSLAFFAFVLGTVVASFLNVVADRYPRGQSVVSPPSHCPECGHSLTPMELLPVLSYLLQRGRCRACGSRIPVRVPIVEASGGLLFAFAVWQFGLTLDAAFAAVLFGFLLLVAVIDLEHKLVLNRVLLLALPVALASALLWSPQVRTPVIDLGGWYVSALADSLMAGLAGFLVFFVFALLSKGGMGGGDVKLAGVLGIWLGFRILPVALLVAVLLGGLVGVLLLISRSFGRKDAIPFAPFLCVGAAIGFLWGETISDWYLRMIMGRPELVG